jgi:hypothetical protein
MLIGTITSFASPQFSQGNIYDHQVAMVHYIKNGYQISKTFYRRGLFYFKDFSSIDIKFLPTNTTFACTIQLFFPSSQPTCNLHY